MLGELLCIVDAYLSPNVKPKTAGATPKEICGEMREKGK